MRLHVDTLMILEMKGYKKMQSLHATYIGYSCRQIIRLPSFIQVTLLKLNGYVTPHKVTACICLNKTCLSRLDTYLL